MGERTVVNSSAAAYPAPQVNGRAPAANKKGENFRSLLIYSKGIQSSSLTRASRYFLRSSKPDLPRSANIFFL